jgi:hypothetical protein
VIFSSLNAPILLLYEGKKAKIKIKEGKRLDQRMALKRLRLEYGASFHALLFFISFLFSNHRHKSVKAMVKLKGKADWNRTHKKAAMALGRILYEVKTEPTPLRLLNHFSARSRRPHATKGARMEPMLY